MREIRRIAPVFIPSKYLCSRDLDFARISLSRVYRMHTHQSIYLYKKFHHRTFDFTKRLVMKENASEIPAFETSKEHIDTLFVMKSGNLGFASAWVMEAQDNLDLNPTRSYFLSNINCHMLSMHKILGMLFLVYKTVFKRQR